MDRDPYAPLSFPLISAVRLGICEVSVVWGTSDFQRVCSVSQISAFLLPRFCSGFSGSRVTGGGGWVGGGANNVHFAVLVLLLFLKSKFCEAAFVSGRGSLHTMLHRSTTQNSGRPIEHKRISSST